MQLINQGWLGACYTTHTVHTGEAHSSYPPSQTNHNEAIFRLLEYKGFYWWCIQSCSYHANDPQKFHSEIHLG